MWPTRRPHPITRKVWGRRYNLIHHYLFINHINPWLHAFPPSVGTGIPLLSIIMTPDLGNKIFHRKGMDSSGSGLPLHLFPRTISVPGKNPATIGNYYMRADHIPNLPSGGGPISARLSPGFPMSVCHRNNRLVRFRPPTFPSGRESMPLRYMWWGRTVQSGYRIERLF